MIAFVRGVRAASSSEGSSKIGFVHVDEHRFRTDRRYRNRRSDVGVRGDDDFVAGPDAQRFDRERRAAVPDSTPTQYGVPT